MYWLDLVRFADTSYNEDQHRNIYPYGDYVIRAFNDGMPFVSSPSQLAGDLFRTDALAAHRVGIQPPESVSTEAGSQGSESSPSTRRLRTYDAAVWMGATLGCAECHDHVDPYTSKDFYVSPPLRRHRGRCGADASCIAMPEIAVPSAADVGVRLDDLRQQLAVAPTASRHVRGRRADFVAGNDASSRRRR